MWILNESNRERGFGFVRKGLSTNCSTYSRAVTLTTSSALNRQEPLAHSFLPKRERYGCRLFRLFRLFRPVTFQLRTLFFNPLTIRMRLRHSFRTSEVVSTTTHDKRNHLQCCKVRTICQKNMWVRGRQRTSVLH